MLDLQERMDKKIVKLATLKSSASLNTKLLREEHNEALNTTKDNGPTETIEEIEKLRQTPENKKGDVMEIGEKQDMLMEQLKELQQSCNEEREK